MVEKNDEKSIRASNVSEVVDAYEQQLQEHGENLGKDPQYLSDEQELIDRLSELSGDIDTLGDMVETFQQQALSDEYIQKNVLRPLRQELKNNTGLRSHEIDRAVEMLGQHLWSRFYSGIEQRDIQFERAAQQAIE